jgi:hypothetical protein
MSNQNIAFQPEQDQKIATNLYCLGGSHAAFGLPPKQTDLAYLSGYNAEARRNQIISDNPLPDELYAKTKQGILWVGYSSLRNKFGKIKTLGDNQDYQGWSIELNGLEIDLITLGDWEQPQIETKWYVYSHHIDAMKLLADLFDGNGDRQLHLTQNIGNDNKRSLLMDKAINDISQN